MTRSLIALTVLALAAASPLRAQGIPALGAAKAAAQKAANATNASIAEQTGQELPNRKPAAASATPAPGAAPAKTTAQPAAQPAKGAAQPAGKPATQPVTQPATQPASQPARQPAAQPAAAAANTTQPVAATAKPAVKDTLRRTVTKDTAKKVAAEAPAEVAFSREVFAYTGDGRRDPFLSLLASGDLRPAYNDLKLVGVAYDPTGRKSVAVMRDVSSNDQYRVKVGQTLGRMRVAQIHPKSVTFTIDEFGYSRQEILALGDSTQRTP